jgi:glycosyltransferase involved in cell wall biosynthesis
LTDNEIHKLTENKYSNRKPYFLFIGAITPRKNLANLIKAYNIYRKNTNQDYPLIIVGGLMHKDKALDNELKNTNYKSDIYFLGNVSNKDQ